MADAATQARIAQALARFRHDPQAFVRWAFRWAADGTELADEPGPRAWQVAILEEVGQGLRAGQDVSQALAPVQIAVASGHGIGKSALVSWLVLWALSTRADTRCVITANTEAQLRTKTWPEIAKWHRLMIHREWLTFTATSIYSADPAHEKTWRADAIPWSEHNTEAFAGLHNKGRRILVVFDEASAIADKVWEVAEGALTDEGTEILWCVFGNPTRNAGRFRECFSRYAHRWSHQQIDSRTVEGTNKAEIAKLVADHGEDSDVVKVRVRGMFPLTTLRQFINAEDVDAAYGKHLKPQQYDFAPVIITVDPAWTGDDDLVIAKRQGLAFSILRVIPKNDNDLQIARLVAQFEDDTNADAVIIDAGFGTGIVSAGRAMGRKWTSVWFSEKSPDEGCLNMRAYMWKMARDWLKSGGAIPKDVELHDELLGPEIVPRMDGKLQIEAKEDMKKRGLRSPNRADALCLSFAITVKSKQADTFRSAVRRQTFATIDA